MVPVSRRRPSPVDLPDSSRYRSTLAIALGLFAMSALIMWAFSGGSSVSIEGEPGYLFSIPGDADKGDIKASLNGPLAVAFYGDRIAVADSGDGKVKIYDWQGKYQDEIDVSRAAGLRKRLAYPTGVAYDDEGRLFVTEIVTDRAYVFDSNHNLAYRFPEKSSSLKLQQPTAIAVSGDEVFVADAGDSSIQVVGLDGTFDRTLVSKASRKTDLAFPNGLAVAADGRVYVADSNNRQVLALDEAGSQVLRFQHRFSLPRGTAIDDLGRVHVVDTFAHKVVVFDSAGAVLFEYPKSQAQDQGGLGFGNGVAVDSETGRAYVTDRGSNSVRVWGWQQEQ